MTYTDYKEQRQKECNALPLFFAFSDEQFEKGMKERGLTTSDEDLKKIISVLGGYCLKTDLPKIKAFLESDNLHELMKDPTFAESAFEYEMWNHEYAINYQADWDVCSCFGTCKYYPSKTFFDYLPEMGYSNEHITAYDNARQAYLKKFIEMN